MAGTDQDVVMFGGCTFDPRSLTLRDAGGAHLNLRSQSLRVLAELALRPGEVVSRDELIGTVWRGIAVTDDSLVQCIKDIRKAIGDTNRHIIRTVVGGGYTLNADRPALQSSRKPIIVIDRIDGVGTTGVSQHFADDLHDRLVLTMAPRSGVRVFSERTAATPADYIVRGRVRVSADRVNLFLSLSGVEENGSFYAEAFDADLSELDRLAEGVARKISSVLRIRVIAYDGERYSNIPNERLDFQQLLAKAHYFYSLINVPSTNSGRAAAQAAVRISPDDPKALALLAHSATQMLPLVENDTSKHDIDWAMSLADRAVTVGASSAFAFRTRANLKLWLLGDHGGCRADCSRALTINPNFYLAHLTLATCDILSGAYLDGIDRLTSFVCLTEIDQQYPYFQSLIGLAWFLAGNSEAAIKCAREAHERSPMSSWHAMVYAAAVSTDPGITSIQGFRAMVRQLDLPSGHFRTLPFTNGDDVDRLETALRAAGLPQTRQGASKT